MNEVDPILMRILPLRMKRISPDRDLYLDENGEIWLYHQSTFPWLTFKGKARE
jgi:hypothetical protein